MNPAANHFELFGLTPRFALDPVGLEATYRALAARVHPDRFVGQSEEVQRIALQQATQVNDAWSTLSRPASRAQYLCQLAGVEPGLEDNTRMPVPFLMQQLEWREGLEEARCVGDAEALELLMAQVRRERKGVLESMVEAFDDARDPVLGASLLRRLMFVERFSEDVERALDALGD